MFNRSAYRLSIPDSWAESEQSQKKEIKRKESGAANETQGSYCARVGLWRPPVVRIGKERSQRKALAR